MHVVILAGGRGSRLRPYTDKTPKPMLPLDGMPILEILVRQLVASGYPEITLALSWRACEIRRHFDNGAWLNASISYSVNETQLGTAGPLGLLEPPNGPCLVANADILTSLDFAAPMRVHDQCELDATVVTAQHELPIRYGVIEQDEDGLLARIGEKPRLTIQISTGIYVLGPSAWSILSPGERVDMPELLERMVAAGKTVAPYQMPADASWIDIGEAADYEAAQAAFRAERARYLQHDLGGSAPPAMELERT